MRTILRDDAWAPLPADAGRMTRPLVGPALVVVGTTHLALGAVAYARPLRAMLDAGVLGSTAGPDGHELPERAAAFWFVTCGAALLPTGALAWAVERTGARVPAAFGWTLGAVAAGGILVMPASGFWALLAVAGVTVVRARQAARDVARPRPPARLDHPSR